MKSRTMMSDEFYSHLKKFVTNLPDGVRNTKIILEVGEPTRMFFDLYPRTSCVLVEPPSKSIVSNFWNISEINKQSGIKQKINLIYYNKFINLERKLKDD